MRCPFCGNIDSQVKDSRPAEDWYDRVEAILRDTLREEASLEAFQQAVARLETPLAVEVAPPEEEPPDAVPLPPPAWFSDAGSSPHATKDRDSAPQNPRAAML